MTEKQFQALVIDAARTLGWRVAHFRPARTAGGWRTPCQADAKGWPDLVLVRRQKVMFVELKVGGRALTPEQAAWAEALFVAGQDVRVWRDTTPWGEIVEVLR